MSVAARYVGRFAPSPTGPLHAGSLVAALASWLDARAAGGRWLVRIEDVDLPRCQSGAAERILAQLAACGLLPDEAPWFQSGRNARYQQVLDGLLARQLDFQIGQFSWIVDDEGNFGLEVLIERRAHFE